MSENKDRGEDGRLCVGVVAGAHGLRGALRVKPFTDAPADLGAFEALTDESGKDVALEVTAVRKNVVIAQIAGVESRADAEKWKGRELFVARAALPELEQDEYYHSDLVGLKAERADGGEFGTVAAVENFGAGDLIEVTTTRGASVILPFTREVVPEVDLAGGRIVVAPPPGLLEEDTE